MADKRIVVVGGSLQNRHLPSNVTGLTTALLLSKTDGYKITVAAKHMPGDYDIQYASPWAGANSMPVSVGGTDAAEWDKNTWFALEELARHHPDSGIHFQKARIFNRKKDVGSDTAKWFSELLSPDPWWKTLFPEYRQIPQAELGADVDNGHHFKSVCINTAIYLPWLVSQCLRNSVVFKRAVFSHINDAAAQGVHHSGQAADVVLNCTGLASRSLGGVADELVYPARGQIVVVRNEADEMMSVSGTDDGPDEVMYMMTRAAGGGTILGGCYQKHNWESQPDPSLALRIMKRCVKACPQLTNGRGIEHLDVIRHGVGLRPVREGGARIEKEKIDGTWVVHNYGHGGAGYQCSYGCAQVAAKLVDEVCRQEKARL
ncbi:D-amino-acid oxidase [Ilyonectria robusta]|uniref:D-amino-acid oxidase n=1 Tax=Ilyonectria robusta TaxID=1079257 RepID=UPI001E8E100E|nr:D-amino-acid oxidase [Ilyonectria robusta]KAH8738016.1 D-amino-acid oxidase [Ilyonectria robusta]